MGNKPEVEGKMSELSTIRGVERFLVFQDREEVFQPVYCCCFRVGHRSYEVPLVVHRKLWRRNLENNFRQLQGTVTWIRFFESVYRNNRHNRQGDIVELQQMRANWEERSSSITDPKNYTQLIQKSIIIGSSLSRKPIRKSVSIKERTSTAKAIVSGRFTRSPVRAINRDSSTENIGEIFANKKYYFDKDTADSMYLFTLFCELIEKHFKTPNTLFERMKDTFVDYIANNDNGSEALITDIHQYIRLTWETVVDYYKVEDLDSISGTNSFFTEENLEALVTSILFRNAIIHGRVFQCFAQDNLVKQRELDQAISRLSNATPQSLQIKPQYCLTQSTVKWFQNKHNYTRDMSEIAITQPYQSCILKMKQLQEMRTPAGKLKLLVGTADLIIDCINKFYERRGMLTKLQALDADQVLSIYSYILVKSRVRNINAHLDIIEMFSGEGQLLSETGYYFSVVSTALQGLTNVVL